MTSAMRTVVTFQSSKFNATESREYYINPGCFGDDLCRWLIAELNSLDFRCEPDPEQEDFGWYCSFTIDDTQYRFVCGYRPQDGDDPGTWIAWIERSTGFISSLFGGANRGIQMKALQQIHLVLSRCPEIHNIRWHTKDNFDKGIEDAGASEPG
jgi:hypothetical protein